MSAGTLTVHQLFDVLTDLDALALQGTTDTSTTYVDDLASPAVRIVFEHDPAAPGYAQSFTIEGPVGTPLYAAGNYPVSLVDFHAGLALGGASGALAMLAAFVDDLGTLALAESADVDLTSLKAGLVIEGNGEGTEFEVAHAATTVNAGGGDDFIVLRMTANDGAFNGGDGYDILWLDTSLGDTNVWVAEQILYTSSPSGSEVLYQSFSGIEFFRGSIGREFFMGSGDGTRFEGGAGADQFSLAADGIPLMDVVAYGEEGGGEGIVVNLGFDPLDTSALDEALEAALAAILAGDEYLFSGLVRDTFGDYDNMTTGLIIEGSQLADFFYGSGFNDAFVGNDGADHFFGGDGDDRIDGGAGEDTFYLSASFSAYVVTYNALDQSLTISAIDGTGTDTIRGVETFSFGGEVKRAAELMPVTSAPAAGDDTNGSDNVVEATAGAVGDSAAQGNVLANDTDADGDPITVIGIRTGSENEGGTFVAVGASREVEGTYGTLTIAQDGAWTYLLDNDRAATNALQADTVVHDIFTYQISAGGETDAATLEIAIGGRNDAPQASNDSGLATNEDKPLVIGAATLLANDADPDNDTLTIASVSSVAGGTATLNADGTISFVPTADFNGQARFSYRVVDGAGGLSLPATATVSVAPVNDAPSFANVGPLAAPAVMENATFVAALSAVDIDSATVTFSLGGVDAGRFAIVGNTLRFRVAPDFEAPADSDRNNAYQVTVTVSDGALSETRNMTIRVRDAAGNTIGGTSGDDRIDSSHKLGGKAATSEADTIDGRDGKDTLAGGVGNDTLLGGKGDDRLSGDAGDDVLRGGAGKDRLDGGAGRDTADFSDASKSVILTLNGAHQARARVGGANDDLVKNIENVTGGKKADQLTGDSGANVLSGGGGHDVLDGGLGADTLSGGSGRDRFVFDGRLGPSNADTIVDFAHNADRIVLDASVFKGIGSSLSTGEFRAGAGVAAGRDRDDRIVYDTATGALYYDRDGNKPGGAAAIKFATLVGAPAIDAGDFLIV